MILILQYCLQTDVRQSHKIIVNHFTVFDIRQVIQPISSPAASGAIERRIVIGKVIAWRGWAARCVVTVYLSAGDKLATRLS
ncbi:MAG: hypothetical protein CMJ81_07425 [Planctomycetaceae bacterium]|nr:hypothetical protein [Planctomycetaceae bacterium]MBP62138.1 hypothetical protein [Planctomycetaceae bacterium]